MTIKSILFFSLVILLVSCKENTESKMAYIAKLELKKHEEHPGKKLMETHCYVCHNPSDSHEKRLAPPMIAIKKHYIDKETTKEAFTKAVLTWIENPNIEDAKMYGAVRRFGVMPKQSFLEEDIKQIADYLYDNEIDQPAWFNELFNEMKSPRQK